MSSKKYLASIPLLFVPIAVVLSGCNVGERIADSSDNSTVRSAKTSDEGVKEGMLPSWVPAGGTNVKLVQSDSGPERIFMMDYASDLDMPQCVPLDVIGKPSDDELARVYASDERTKNLDAEEMSKTRTLEADWWPADAELKTTDLCGRFWTHQIDGKLYAFAPDTKEKVQSVLKERAEPEKLENK